MGYTIELADLERARGLLEQAERLAGSVRQQGGAFLVKDGGRTYRVHLGARPSCTCGCYREFGGVRWLCPHAYAAARATGLMCWPDPDA